MTKLSDPEIAMIIIDEVCKYFQCKYTTASQQCRISSLKKTRHYSYYFMKKYTRLSLRLIADHFNQAHSNVSCALKKLSDHMIYRDVQNDISRIDFMIQTRLESDDLSFAEHIGCLITNYNQVEA